jgi:hypothetical protein
VTSRPRPITLPLSRKTHVAGTGTAEDMGSITTNSPSRKFWKALPDISYNRNNGTLRYHLDPGSDSRRVWKEPRPQQEPTELSPATRASRFQVGSVRR